MENDQRNDQGTLTYANGDVYEGEFKDNQFNGYVKYTWANGAVYKGNWENDKRID